MCSKDMATGKRPNAGDLRRFLVAKRIKRGNDDTDDSNLQEPAAPPPQWSFDRTSIAAAAIPQTSAIMSCRGKQTHDEITQHTATATPKTGYRPTRVVKLRRSGGCIVQDCDVYIGRRWTVGGWDLPQSEWANPYSVRSVGSAAEAVRLYEHEHLPRHPELLARVGSLRGLVLGCWCKKRDSDPCHGDVLARLADAASERHPFAIEDIGRT